MRKLFAFIAVTLVIAGIITANATTNQFSLKQIDNPLSSTTTTGSVLTCASSPPYTKIISVGPFTLNPQDIVVVNAGVTGVASGNLEWEVALLRATSSSATSGTVLSIQEYQNFESASSQNISAFDTGATGTYYYNLVSFCVPVSGSQTVSTYYLTASATVLRR
jgi:Tfp pilus assembly protein PilV